VGAQVVRHHRELPMLTQSHSEIISRRATINYDRFAIVNQCNGSAGDAHFCVGLRIHALNERDLTRYPGVGRDGPTVRAHQQTALLQGVQIAANRVAGDAELRHQLGHCHLSTLVHEGDKLVLPQTRQSGDLVSVGGRRWREGPGHACSV
jgi:hypothetical protein